MKMLHYQESLNQAGHDIASLRDEIERLRLANEQLTAGGIQTQREIH